MKKKRGHLPGRYVPPHIRKWPDQPSKYVNASEYQERVEPPPSPVQTAALQGELDLLPPPTDNKDSGEGRTTTNSAAPSS